MNAGKEGDPGTGEKPLVNLLVMTHDVQHAGASLSVPSKSRTDGDSSVLTRLTTQLVDTYSKCGLLYSSQPKLERRILTKNSQVTGNNGWDNSDNNIVLRVRDILGVLNKDGAPKTFVVLDLLGQGTFGQVFRCQDIDTKELVAIKIIRNHPSYYKQALVEIHVTKMV
jgi:hypothetical protein